jgi:hypothetical protein
MMNVEITKVKVGKKKTVHLEVTHVAGGRKDYAARSSCLTADELKSYLLSLVFLSADGEADLVNDDTAWVVDVDKFPNPEDRFLQAAFMAREKAQADAGGVFEHDFVQWLWGTNPAEALDVTRTILTKSGNKLLEFVAKNMLREPPAQRGQPPKFAEEITRAYFDLALEKAASAAEQFIPTNKEVFKKLEDFRVWVRLKKSSDPCPAGFEPVNQKTVETSCAKLRNRDEANPTNRKQLYEAFASQRVRREAFLEAKRSIRRWAQSNPEIQKLLEPQRASMLNAESADAGGQVRANADEIEVEMEAPSQVIEPLSAAPDRK